MCKGNEDSHRIVMRYLVLHWDSKVLWQCGIAVLRMNPDESTQPGKDEVQATATSEIKAM
jgi:hypothetical protein